MIIAAVALVLIYAVLDGLRDAYMFKDFRVQSPVLRELLKTTGQQKGRWFGNANKMWHRLQFLQQGAFILSAAWIGQSWQIIPLGAGLFWLVQDGLVNRVGLDRPFFFVGTTAWLDRLFQKTGHPRTFMAICKIFLILAGLALFLIFPK